MRKTAKNGEKLRNFARKGKKERKSATVFNRRGRKGRRDFLDRMTGFFRPRKGTKSQNFLTAESAEELATKKHKRHKEI